MNKRHFFIVNPAARSCPADVSRRIRARFPDAAIESTRWAGDAARLARQAMDYAQSPDDVIVACGGDGTFREVAETVGDSRLLAILGLGTVNQIPAQLGIAPTVEGALEVVAMGVPADVYPGLVAFDGERKWHMFFIGVSAGLDADVVGMVNPAVKKLIGEGAYGVAFLKRALKPVHKSVSLSIVPDADTAQDAKGTEALAAQVIVLSNGLYGGKFRFSSTLSPLSRGLQVVASTGGLISTVRLFLSSTSNPEKPFSGFSRFIESGTVELSLNSGPGYFQLDGDPLVANSAMLTSGRLPIRVLVPSP